MKRLAVLVKPENVNEILSSLKDLKLEATIYDVKGVTKDKERVASGRGSGTVERARQILRGKGPPGDHGPRPTCRSGRVQGGF